MEQTNNDNNDNDLDQIRAPDPVIKERLVDYNYGYDFSYLESSSDDFDKILKQSLEDFEMEEMQKIEEMLAIERRKITEKYTNIKLKLQKVQTYDATNKDKYDTVISIIELYESNFIETYLLDETSYQNVFKLLKSIRLTKEEMILLESLIVF